MSNVSYLIEPRDKFPTDERENGDDVIHVFHKSRENGDDVIHVIYETDQTNDFTSDFIYPGI